MLGSLIDPANIKDGGIADWADIQRRPPKRSEVNGLGSEKETAVAAQGLAQAATLLGREYTWVVTNVPYKRTADLVSKLSDFIETNYPRGKTDLATAFLERCLTFLQSSGSVSVVTPQNWLFLSSYKKLRPHLLKVTQWNILARLGPGAFDTIDGEVVKAILLTLSKTPQSGQRNEFFVAGANRPLRGLDVSQASNVFDKASGLQRNEVVSVSQAGQLENTNAVIKMFVDEDLIEVGSIGYVRGGITTGDSLRFRRSFHEVDYTSGSYSYQVNTTKSCDHYSGRDLCILWEKGHGSLADAAINAGATIAGRDAWGKLGIAITYTGTLRPTIYKGELFEECHLCNDSKRSRILYSTLELLRIRRIQCSYKVRQSKA